MVTEIAVETTVLYCSSEKSGKLSAALTSLCSHFSVIFICAAATAVETEMVVAGYLGFGSRVV